MNVKICGMTNYEDAAAALELGADRIGFVSLSGKDYRLASSSPYKGKASNGGDPGADVAAVTSRTAGVKQ